MGLKLHGEGATEAGNLQELFQELKALDGTNGKGDFFQIEGPNPAEMPEEDLVRIREEIRERVIQLFAASAAALIDTGDKKPLMRDYVPVPGQATRYFDKDDLGVFADDVRRLLDPNDSHFHAALADREVGAIQLLGKTLNFAIDHGDPRAAFKHFQRLTRGVRLGVSAPGVSIPEDIIPPVDRELTELPWEREEGDKSKDGVYRKDILRNRLQEMITLDYRLKNPRLVETLRKRFPAQQRLLTQLVDGFNAATLDLNVPDFDREQWFFILFSNLEKATAKTSKMGRKLYDELIKLARAIRIAGVAQHVSAAIDTFVQKTLPLILQAQAKAPGAPAAAASTASQPPASSEEPAPDAEPKE